LSSDSTCTNHLRSATKGYETLTLKPHPHKSWPLAVQEEGKTCILPDWAQGKWEALHVQEGTLILKDHRNFKTFSAKCVNPTEWPHNDRFLLYSRTHCGEEHYNCIWLKNRGDNTLEFQIGNFFYRNDFFECLAKLSLALAGICTNFCIFGLLMPGFELTTLWSSAKLL